MTEYKRYFHHEMINGKLHVVHSKSVKKVTITEQMLSDAKRDFYKRQLLNH